MAEDKKKSENRPAVESENFSEALAKRNNTRDHVLSVMQRVPITPTPTRPPDKDKK